MCDVHSSVQTEAFVRPAPETTAAVNTWLAEHNISAKNISPAGDWLAFSIPVSKASQLFATEFGMFMHTATGREAIRALEYSIPADLAAHINFVHPTVS